MSLEITCTIKLMLGSTPVEFRMDAEGGISFEDVKEFVDNAMLSGFTVPKAYQPATDVIGKKGRVVKISAVEGTKMYEVKADMDDGTPFAWKEFSPTAFRYGDRIEVVKNDRGFKVGKLIDEMPDQKPLAF